MFGVAAVVAVREKAAELAAGFDPALVSATDAARVVEELCAAEHMLATVKGLAAKRMSDTELWRRQGDRSPAHHLARLSGSSVGKAKEVLDTAGALGSLPKLEQAARKGEVSPSQAGAIAEAATVNPGAEAQLLQRAKTASLGELRDDCARAKAAAQRDAEARHRAIHAARSLRRRRLADGASELTYRSTPEEVAEVFAVVRGFGELEFRQARSEGRREPEEAYLADGLLAMARAAARRGSGDDEERQPLVAAGAGGLARGSGGGGGGGSGAGAAGLGGLFEPMGEAAAVTDVNGARGGGSSAPAPAGSTEADGNPGPAPDGGTSLPARGSRGTRTTKKRRGRRGPAVPVNVVVRVDWDALIRGWPLDGEVCEIAGVGPVAVSAVQAMMRSGDAFLAAVVTRGVDLVSAAHLGRRPTAHQRTAWRWLHPVCTVEGCNASARLEADHRVPWKDDKVTLLSNLDGPCPHHHDLKTYKGWALVDGVGPRPMVAPDDPRHPDNVAGGRQHTAARPSGSQPATGVGTDHPVHLGDRMTRKALTEATRSTRNGARTP